MTIGVLTIELSICNSSSLKDKRMILKSLKDRIRKHFNISIAELDNHEKWRRATLGVVNVNTDSRTANSILSRVVELVKSTHSVDLLDYNIELL